VLLPVADRRERPSRGGGDVAPEVEHHRLAGGVEGEAVGGGEGAVWTADVLPEGEERAVGLEEVDRLAAISVELDLELHRVRLHVDEPARGGELGERLGAAVEIEDQMSGADQALELSLAHAVAAPVVVEG